MRWQLFMTLGIEIIIMAIFQRVEIVLLFFMINTATLFYVMEKLRRTTEITEHLTEARNGDISVKIAHETLPYLRHGLNEKNAHEIAKIIQEIGQVAAVSITDCEKQLAYLGVGCDQHHPGDRILTEATREVIRTGQYKVVRTQKQLNCARQNICDCPLAAAIIVPLLRQGEVVGTVKLYETKDGQLSPDLVRLASGMGQLLGLQIELAELDHHAKLTAEAQLSALQAQINPHFLFNVMNTIIATSRSNPNRTRRLLILLAQFFRRALKARGTFITIYEEMEFVNIYLILEKARFGRKLVVKEEISEDMWNLQIPRLSIQPLVENAVKHGITAKMGNGTVLIKIAMLNSEINVQVQDDGAGIPADRLKDVLKNGVGSGNGVGMANVHERLRAIYGVSYGLKIESELGKGTTVTMSMPITSATEEKVV
ncbi:MAG: histidine kinase [Desulfitobacteriaceae bacterium]